MSLLRQPEGNINPSPKSREPIFDKCITYPYAEMPQTYDYSTIARVQHANDIVDLVSEHLSLTKKGREMVGLCPFHEDHRPSLCVNPEKQIFKCFACGAGGSIFTFVQMRENLTFPQALQRLAERAGIRIGPLEKHHTRPDGPDSQLDPNTLAKLNAWAAEHFRSNLNHPHKGRFSREYLEQRRISPQSIEQWQIGLALADNDLLNAARTAGKPEKLLAQAGLAVSQGPAGLADKFVNRLMFPIADASGRITAFGGRTLDNADAKYINSPATALFDKSNSIYGLNHAKASIAGTRTVLVVEGYTDCIIAHQFGFQNAVATLGTSFTAGHARILGRFAKKIIVLFDNDTAGAEAANRALDVCLSQRIDIKLASVPDHKDPADFLLSAGKEPFECLLRDAVDVFDFKYNRLLERFNTDDTLTGRKAAIDEFLRTITTAIKAGNLAAIDIGLIVNRLAAIIGLTPKQINAELARRLARRPGAAAQTGAQAAPHAAEQPQGYFAAAQREILEVLLNEPGLFAQLGRQINPQIFEPPIYNQIAALIFEARSRSPNAPLADIVAAAESPELSAVMVEMAQAGEKKANYAARLAAAVDAVNRCLKRRTLQIKDVKDEAGFLKDLCENAARQNPHSLGMI